MRITPLALLLVLVSCSGGGGAETSVVVNQTNNQNQNSQNGDIECSFECRPVQIGASVGFEVTEICNGAIHNGPNFSPSAPQNCQIVQPNEFAQPENVSAPAPEFDLQGDVI